MSPEQAQGDRRILDFHTDIYSLGATLFELLTLQPVVQATDRSAMIDEILYQEPRPCGKWTAPSRMTWKPSSLRGDGETGSERYATAGELAADLRRFVGGEPILARRPTRLQRCSHWCRRHRVGVTSALVALVGVSDPEFRHLHVMLMHERAERQRTKAALEAVETRERRAQHLIYAPISTWPSMPGATGMHGRWSNCSIGTCRWPGEEDLRGFEWFLLRQLARREHADLIGAQATGRGRRCTSPAFLRTERCWRRREQGTRSSFCPPVRCNWLHVNGCRTRRGQRPGLRSGQPPLGLGGR
jgi:hypothetical protein